jgi:non-ribosomal peptide synthase protein (TIGR01720 family)
MSADDDRISALTDSRRALLARWTATRAAPAAESPRTATERLLAEIWQDVLNAEPVQNTHSFLELGGDSISSLQVVAKAAWRGLRLTSRQVIEAADLRALAAVADDAGPAAGAVDDVAVGEVDLTPIQRWFFEQEIPDSHFWDQAILLDVDPSVDAAVLSRALGDLLVHHDVLRSRFRRADGRWVQHVPETAPDVPVLVVAGDTAQAIAAAQRCIDLESGPMAAAALISAAPQRPARLLLAVHHLVVDGVSVRILLADLETAYRARRNGTQPVLPPRTTSFRRWAQALRQFAGTPQIRRQAGYWQSVPHAEAVVVPADRPIAVDTMASAKVLTTSLTPELTRRLVRDLPRTRGVPAQQVLLAAFLLAWHRRTGRPELQLDLEGHGREAIDDVSDVSRTVGWFTSIYPVRFALSGDPSTVLDRVRRKLDEVPNRGIGYGLLRYLGGDPDLAELPQSAVSFNYLGRFEPAGRSDAVFGMPVEVPTVLQSDRAVRRYALEIIATVAGERLLLEWRYNAAAFDEATIRSFLHGQAAAVGELLDAAGGTGDGTGHFPLATLPQSQLDLVRRQMQDGAR